MNNQFKKLFDISYKEKTFTIFVDENHRYTFLEKNKEGKYIYPTIEDFIYLNKIYNVHNPFVLQSSKKYTFKEKVKVGALVLSLSVLTTYCGANNTIENKEKARIEENTNNAMDTMKNMQEEAITDNIAGENWDVSIGEEEVNVKKETSYSQQFIPISSLSELDTILPYSTVSLEDINKAIETNNKLDKNFKNLSYNLAVAIYDSYPDADLRIYYANLLTLETEKMSKEEYEEIFQDYSVAKYNIFENKIYYMEGSDIETLVHELSHTTYSIIVYANNQVYCHKSSYHALDETMNNKVVDLVTPSTSYSYLRTIGDYLFTFDEFDFNRYMEEGPNYILNDIKKMYPTIDVSYINDSLNAMKNSNIKLGERITIEECPDLLDELFQLCKEKAKENISGENIYSPFLEFTNLFPNNEELFTKYLNEYNTYLETLQLDAIISEEDLEKRIEPYKEVKGFLRYEETLYPCIDTKIEEGYDIIMQDGEEKQRPRIGGFYFPFELHSLHLKKELLENPSIEINSEFWKVFLVRKHNIPAVNLYKTTILLNGNVLTNDYLGNLDIQIGETSTNQIGFIIRYFNNNNKVIYQSEEDLKNLSPRISLKKYYSPNLDNVGELELSTILNEEYLKKMQIKENIFSNLFVDKDKLILEPYHFLALSNENGKNFGIDLNQCLLVFAKDFEVSNTSIGLNIEILLEEPIYLKDVLNYYNLLEDNQVTYVFTEAEIKELVEKYIEEMNYTQTR